MRILFIIAALFLLAPNPSFANHHDNADGQNPFVLIARVHVKAGKVEEYLKIAEEVDQAVEQSEPGMLFHNFDADPEDPLAFTWTEVYKNSEAFLVHTSNPPVLDYVGKHAELGDGFSIEIYGDVSEAVLANIEELGFTLKHFRTTRVGYVRNQHF